jgi:transposase
MKPPIEPVELNLQDLEARLERARQAPLTPEDYLQFKAALETLAYLTHLLEDRDITLQRLRQILFSARSEKTRQVLPVQPQAVSVQTTGGGQEPGRPEPAAGQKKPPGHGRQGARAYSGATRIKVGHPSLKSGDRCPECLKGKIYGQKTPAFLVQVRGQAPIQATVYELEKLRCNLCGEVFTAEAPQGVEPEKYDATAASMIALLKYGSGLPFHRLERLQQNLGIPLPASTQWDLVQAMASRIEPAHQELIRQAAQGEVLYNDDTSMKILELIPPEPSEENASERSGTFTSGIVSTRQGQPIALFFTGRQHAGENLADLLAHRPKASGPPIQMCDALARNLPPELDWIVAHCLVHARRRFVEVAPNFPQPCRFVLEVLGQVYRHEATAREQGMSAEERLRFHQTQSGPLMDSLKHWLTEQFETRQVEPNSGLGTAITYMTRHWDRLTLFLRQPGAPLDNNVFTAAGGSADVMPTAGLCRVS